LRHRAQRPFPLEILLTHRSAPRIRVLLISELSTHIASLNSDTVAAVEEIKMGTVTINVAIKDCLKS
jgi:hypothetical protein